jgi:hypothetical protein
LRTGHNVLSIFLVKGEHACAKLTPNIAPSPPDVNLILDYGLTN